MSHPLKERGHLGRESSSQYVRRMTARTLRLMKCSAFLILLLFAIPQLTAQPTILNENSRLEILPTGEKAIEWYGKLDRTYFMQVSASDKPLAKWKWAPLIESGNNEYISHQVEGTAEKGFFRLQYTDQPIPNGQTIDSADFDSDGLSNLQEITPAIIGYHSIQTNPLDPDTDHDGLTDKWERDHGLNPTDDGTVDPVNGPNGDPDFDKFTNLAEQTAGTNPQDSSSYPSGTPLPGGAPLLVGEQIKFGGTRWGQSGFQNPGRKYLKLVGHVVSIDPDNWGFGGELTATVTTDVRTGNETYNSTGSTAYDWGDAWTVESNVSRSRDGIHPPWGATSTSSQTLSDEYTIPAFIANVESWQPAYLDRFTVADYWVSPYHYYAMFKTITANISLTPEPNDPYPAIYYYITKLHYKWKVNPAPNQVVSWMEVFTPADGTKPSAEGKSWVANPTDTESPVYEIDPTAMNEKKNGSYSVLPVEVTVAFGLGPEPLGPKTSRELLETYLETVKVSRTGDTWFVKFTDAQGLEKFYGVEIVTTKEKLIDALKRPGQKVVFDGHSNFGLGPNLSGKVTHKTIADFTHFGVGKTSIPKSFRGEGTETDVVPFTNGDGTTLPTIPRDLAAIDRVYAEGWAYLKLEPGEIIQAPQNYKVAELGIERFKNLQGVAPGSNFTKQGIVFNNEWHFDSPEGSRRLIVQAPSTDVPTLGYAKFFYNACNTGRDYIESFKHGDFIYTKDSCRVEKATQIFVQGIIEGKSNDQIMTDLNQDGVGNSENQSPQIYGLKTF